MRRQRCRQPIDRAAHQSGGGILRQPIPHHRLGGLACDRDRLQPHFGHRGLLGGGDTIERHFLPALGAQCGLGSGFLAQALGFVRDVVDDAEQAAERARQLAAEIASYAPLTVRAAKEGLRRRRAGGRDAEDADLLDTCYLSDDFREGVDAFVERREPRWTGR